jgi:hypothetical protein
MSRLEHQSEVASCIDHTARGGAVEGPLNGLRVLELGHFIAGPTPECQRCGIWRSLSTTPVPRRAGAAPAAAASFAPNARAPSFAPNRNSQKVLHRGPRPAAHETVPKRLANLGFSAELTPMRTLFNGIAGSSSLALRL